MLGIEARTWSTTVLVAIALVLSGCARPSLPRSGPPSPGQASPLPEYWLAPIGDGVTETDAAAADLLWVPDVPDRLGTPVEIVATDPAAGHPAFREIAWLFDHPKFGHLVVIEMLTNEAGAKKELEELVSTTPRCHPASPPSGFGSATSCTYAERAPLPLVSGASAVRVIGDGTTAVYWVEPVKFVSDDAEKVAAEKAEFKDPALYVSLLAPSSELTAEEALEAANSV